MKKTMFASAVLALLALAASLVMWDKMPANMPTHWGINGNPDSFMPKQIALFLFPAMVFFVPLLIVGVLALDPRRKNVEQSASPIAWMVNGLAVFLLALHLLTLRAATMPKMQLSSELVMALVGGLFLMLGALLPRVKSNWFVGIRTPWTLSSEGVWERTHKVGGLCMLVGGFAAILASLLVPNPVGTILFASILAVSGLLPVVLSYIYFRQEQSHS